MFTQRVVAASTAAVPRLKQSIAIVADKQIDRAIDVLLGLRGNRANGRAAHSDRHAARCRYKRCAAPRTVETKIRPRTVRHTCSSEALMRSRGLISSGNQDEHACV